MTGDTPLADVVAADDPIRVDPTLLMDVARCKTYAWLRHVRGVAAVQDAAALLAGSAVHKAIADFLLSADGSRAVATFHAAYDERFAALPAEQLDPRFTPTNIGTIVARWCEMHPPALQPWAKVLLIEEAFAVPLVAGVELVVRPDAVVEFADGQVSYVDTKTTGWMTEPWKAVFRTDAQGSLYTYAVQRRYGARARLGGYVSAIELKALPASDRTCHDHKRPYSECGYEHAKFAFVEAARGEEMLARAVMDAAMQVREYLRLCHLGADGVLDWLPMDGAFNGRCMFCRASEFCAAGRPVAAIDSLFIPSPWIVQPGVRED